MSSDETQTLAEVQAAATMPGASRLSPLRRWMSANRTSFAETLAAAGARPNWTRIAEVLAARGLTDAEGKPPSGKVASLTWWKVRKGTAARAEGAPARTTPVQRPEKPREPAGVPVPQDDAATDLRPRLRRIGGWKEGTNGQGNNTAG